MCLMCADDSTPDHFCKACWAKLPLRAKDYWWQESDYGKIDLDDEQVAKLHGLTAVD